MTKEIDTEQMVADLRLAAEQVMTHCLQNTTWAFDARQAVSGLQEALDKSAPIADRWCLASERQKVERDFLAMTNRANEWKADAIATAVRAEKAEAAYETARARGLRLDSELDGVCQRHQAASHRLRMATEVIAALRQPGASGTNHGLQAIAAWDGQPKTYTVDQLRTAFAEACMAPETPFFKEWPAIAAAVERALASESKRKEMVAEVWGVETRNGGWLGLGVALTGSGSSVDIVKAHRFATKEEAEKVASEFSFAGGMAKRIDGEAVVARVDELAKDRDIANANAVAWEARAEKLEARLTAQTERLRLASETIETLRTPLNDGEDNTDAIAAWDAVPPKFGRPRCPVCKNGIMVPDGDETYCDLMCGHRVHP